MGGRCVAWPCIPLSFGVVQVTQGWRPAHGGWCRGWQCSSIGRPDKHAPVAQAGWLRDPYSLYGGGFQQLVRCNSFYFRQRSKRLKPSLWDRGAAGAPCLYVPRSSPAGRPSCRRLDSCRPRMTSSDAGVLNTSTVNDLWTSPLSWGKQPGRLDLRQPGPQHNAPEMQSTETSTFRFPKFLAPGFM